MIRETVGNIIKAKESILVFRGRKEQVFSGSVGKQVRDELVDPVMILRQMSRSSRFISLSRKTETIWQQCLRKMPQL